MAVSSNRIIKQNIENLYELRDINHRYASFDICYSYFYNNRDKLISSNIESSCLHLWSYLASWGMLRGSSNLLQRSPASLVPVIEHISEKYQLFWKIDVDNYMEKDHIKRIVEEFNNLKNILKDKVLGLEPSVVLITKIMLGVYGNIPAFDTYFTKTFRTLYPDCGFRTVTKESLECINDFYKSNCSAFCKTIKVLNFAGEDTDIIYPKAKLVDMFGFNYSNISVHKK